ncbi:MAG: hypothetical protein ACRDTC_04350 [Pseudonocardiaceae bacterium]
MRWPQQERERLRRAARISGRVRALIAAGPPFTADGSSPPGTPQK